MKIAVHVDTNEHLNVAWPDGVPLPNAGDQVVMKVSQSGSIGFVVEHRFYGIGVDPQDGSPMTTIHIKGRSLPRDAAAEGP